MNRQFYLLTTSLLFSLVICCSACDMGTYNNRFENRSQAVPAGSGGGEAASAGEEGSEGEAGSDSEAASGSADGSATAE